jgi:hypothetical protein
MNENGRRKEQVGTKLGRSALGELSLYGVLAFLMILASTATKAQPALASAGKSDATAIDISLEPGATMLKYAAANNARLLKVYPKGFALDAAHSPHITLVQRFVRTADLEKLYTVVGEVLSRAHVTSMKLEAFKYYHAHGGPVGVAGICAKPTPEILKTSGGYHCRRNSVCG